MEDNVLKSINDLRIRERTRCKIIHHRLIYNEALDDLTALLYGDDKAKEILEQIEIAYEKQLKRKFLKGVISATLFFIIFLLL